MADFKERYRALADKHEAMIAFYGVELEYNLAELEEEFFESLEEIKKLDFKVDVERLKKDIGNSTKTIF